MGSNWQISRNPPKKACIRPIALALEAIEHDGPWRWGCCARETLGAIKSRSTSSHRHRPYKALGERAPIDGQLAESERSRKQWSTDDPRPKLAQTDWKLGSEKQPLVTY